MFDHDYAEGVIHSAELRRRNVFNTFGVSIFVDFLPRVRRCAATLDFGIEPLRGKNRK